MFGMTRAGIVGGEQVEPGALPLELRDYFNDSPIALSIAPAADDYPLTLVNSAFAALTGYACEAVVGRNCRFLQGAGEARDTAARAGIRQFLASHRQTSIRAPILNFRQDGTPFVNLLYLSKLRARSGAAQYIFASQFDVSRTQPDLLRDYDAQLGRTLARLGPVFSESDIVLEGSLTSIANSVALIAQAKLTLSELDPGL